MVMGELKKKCNQLEKISSELIEAAITIDEITKAFDYINETLNAAIYKLDKLNEKD